MSGEAEMIDGKAGVPWGRGFSGGASSSVSGAMPPATPFSGFAPTGAPPVEFGAFPSLLDAARQQTELVCWVAKKVQEHDSRIQSLLASGVGAGLGGGDASSGALSKLRCEGKPSALEALRQKRETLSRQLLSANEDDDKRPSDAGSETRELATRDLDASDSSPSKTPPKSPSLLNASSGSLQEALEEAASAASAARRKAKSEGKSEAEVAAAAAGASAAYAATAAARATKAAANVNKAAQEKAAEAAAVLAAAAAAGDGAGAEGGDGVEGEGGDGDVDGSATAAAARSAGAAAALAMKQMKALEGVFQRHVDESGSQFEAMAGEIDSQASSVSEALQGVSDSFERKIGGLADYVRQQLDSHGREVEGSIQSSVRRVAGEAIERSVPDILDKIIPEKLRAFDEEVDRKINEKFMTRLNEGLLGSGSQPAMMTKQDSVTRGSVVDAETMMSMRLLQADVLTRLPALESSYSQLKDIRLQMPDMRNDVDELRASLNDVAVKLERQTESLAKATSATAAASAKAEEAFAAAGAAGAAGLAGAAGAPGAPGAVRASGADQSRISRHDSTEGFGEDSDDEVASGRGAAAGAHAPTANKPRLDLGAALASYQATSSGGDAAGAGDSAGAGGSEEQRSSQSQAETPMGTDGNKKLKDIEQLLMIFEDRLKEMDGEHRTATMKTTHRLDQLAAKVMSEDEDNTTASKMWNLSQQVDVVQSLINNEMNHIRRSVEHTIDKKLLEFAQDRAVLDKSPPGTAARTPSAGSGHTDRARSAAGKSSGGDGGGRSRSNSPESTARLAIQIQEIEEKVKFLQNAYQQNTLKIAGMKTAAKHVENQGASNSEQIKKIAEEAENLSDQFAQQQVRLDYLALHIGAPGIGQLVPDATTFVAATGSPSGIEAPPGRRRSSGGGTGAGAGAASSRPPRRASAGAVGASVPSTPQAPLTPLGPAVPQIQIPPSVPATPASGSLAVPGAVGGSDEASQGLLRSTPRTSQGVEMQQEMNTARIARLGKKVSDMDSNMLAQFEKLRGECMRQAHQLAQIIAFLPRRQRRTVEKILREHSQDPEADDKKDEEQEKPEVAKKDGTDGDRKKKIGFSDNIEVRHFQVMEDSVMPWQEVGEPDQRWWWCHQGMNEMGRELAKHLEQMDHEREEFERDMQREIDRLQQELRRSNQARFLSGGSGADGSASPSGERGGGGGGRGFGPRRSPMRGGRGSHLTNIPSTREHAGSAAAVVDDELYEDSAIPEGPVSDRMNARLERALVTQIAALEERVERLSSEARDLKRAQESRDAKKADKEELQLITMRLALFDRVDPRQFDARLEALESWMRDHEGVHEQVGDRIQNVEIQSARRTDLSKVRETVVGLKQELKLVADDVKANVTSIYNANRHTTAAHAELRALLDKQVTKLQDEKLNTKDFAELQEKVLKVELSVRDNRTILSDSGSGSEVNAVVKRIILNMEDKIMVLEKKIDAIAEMKGCESELFSGSHHPSPGAMSHTASEGAALQSASAEVQNLLQAVSQLKQDISISKVDIEQINIQGMQQIELAQRLNVLVEGSVGDEHGETGGTAALSLNRVQVMISAAARQLVAGSKWITKETFDLRLGEFRKEYMTGSRQLQSKIEEIGSIVLNSPPRPNQPRLTSAVQSMAGSAAPSMSALPLVAGGSQHSAPVSARSMKPLKRNEGLKQGEYHDWPEVMSPATFAAAAKTGANKDRPGASLALPRAGPRPGAAGAGSGTVILNQVAMRPTSQG